MPNKCAVIYCCSGFKSKSSNTNVNTLKLTSETTVYNKENSVFAFPDALKRLELRKKWIKFVNRKNWFPTEHSGVCSAHFDPKFLKHGVRMTLIYDLHLIPTIYSNDAIKKIPPSLLLSIPGPSRKSPTRYVTSIQDESDIFMEKDSIKDLEMLNSSSSPVGFIFQKYDSHVLYYRIFNVASIDNAPCIESIQVDSTLHVKLHHNRYQIPLPKWFKQNQHLLKNISILENLASYMRIFVAEKKNTILDEIHSIQYYKPKGRKPYSSEVLRFSLLQRYTSKQAYIQLQEKIPLPSLSVLKKLAAGGIEPLKAIKLLLEEGKVDPDCILMLDEMYLQKCSEYSSGKYVGLDKNGNFFKSILVFMVVSLKKSIPYVIKSCPQTKINGDTVFLEIKESLSVLKLAGDLMYVQ